MKKYLTFILALIFLAGCSPALPTKPSSEAVPTSFVSFPTETPIPASTMTPTQTPQIPVQIGTPFPRPVEKITRDNVSNLVELVNFQNGHKIARYTAGLEKLFMADQSGITICKTKDAENFIDCESVINHFDIFVIKNDDRSFNTGNFQITPDGRYFLAVTDAGLQVFDENGNDFITKPLPKGNYAFALSPDGKLVSIQKNKNISIIRTADGEEVFSDDGTQARFSTDGKYLAVQKRMAVYLYSETDWSNTFSFPQNQLDGWDISGNGEIIANINGKDLVIHRLSDGGLIKTLSNFDGGDVLLSKEGKYALQVISYVSSQSLYEKSISIWDIESGDSSFPYTYEVVDLSHLNINDDGLLFYSSMEKPWKSLAASQIIYLSDTDDVLIETGYPSNPYGYPSELCMLTETSKTICEIIYSPQFFDWHGQHFVQIPDKPIATCPFNKRAGEDGAIRENQCNIVVESESLNRRYILYAILPQENQAMIQILFSLQDTRMIDLKTGEALNRWKGIISFPKSSSDNKFIAFLNREWPTFAINTFLYSGNMANSSPNRMGVYNTQKNELRFFGNENRPSSYTFTAGNQLLGIINEKTQGGADKIVEYPLNSEQTQLLDLISYSYSDEPEKGRLNAIAISPNDDLLITGTNKGYVLVYDFSTKGLITQWQAFDNASILAVAFTRDGRNIITSSEFGEIKLWGAAPFEWNTGK